jgi:DNA-binding NtrC family response regulator
VPPSDPSTDSVTPFKDAKRTLIDEFEREYVQRLLERTGGNISRAAKLAGVERHYFKALCRKHELRERDDAGD